MIWIIWHLFIVADAIWNYLKDKAGFKIYHGLESLYRIIAGVVLALVYGLHNDDWKIKLMFGLGTFFSFWLWFNPLLNDLRHQPLDHLGNNILDKIEAKMPSIVARFFWKAVLASGFIYAFYNTNLL